MPRLPPPQTIELPPPITPFPVGAPSRAPTPDPAELTIQFVQRLPSIDYVPHSANPTVEGWPAVGQQVTWRANVKNWFTRDVTVAYRWRLDAGDVAEGVVTIAAGAVGTVDYTMPWTFDRHELTFTIDPANAIAEEDEDNNALTTITNALSVGFYVEQSFYDYFRANQYFLAGAHSTSFEDWAQRQIALYNEVLKGAVYPETPHGVTDRLRLDRITLVADGKLPLALGTAAAHPNLADRSVDLQWGFPASALNTPQYRDLRRVAMENQFYYSGVVQHELGHARGLIDEYGFAVYDGFPGHSVDVTHDGTRVAGSAWMPGSPLLFNGFPGQQVLNAEEGMMAATWTFMDRYSAAMWNQMTGRRAVDGNYNAPGNLGWFLNAFLPAHNRFIFADPSGRRLSRARVLLFRAAQSKVLPVVPYGREFTATPDLIIASDAAGEIVLDQNPFAVGSPVVHDGGYANGVLLFAVERNGRWGYAFVTVRELTYEYLAGHTDEANYIVRVVLR